MGVGNYSHEVARAHPDIKWDAQGSPLVLGVDANTQREFWLAAPLGHAVWTTIQQQNAWGSGASPASALAKGAKQGSTPAKAGGQDAFSRDERHANAK